MPLLLLLLLLPTLAVAQTPDTSTTIGDACSDSTYRAFDFWVGEWVVRDSTGARMGTSRVTHRAKGCGLLEEWTGTSGSRGISLNYYDPAADAWHQDWVGGNGRLLHLTGGRSDRAMVLTGTRSGPDGPVRDRIRWEPLPDGRVQQEWTISDNEGQTWKRVFLGIYHPPSP